MWKKTCLLIISLLLQPGISVYFTHPYVTDLKDHEFDFIIGKGFETWAIYFHLPYHKLSDDGGEPFDRVAKMMAGLIKCGAVNVKLHPILAHRFDVRKIPSIVFITKDYEDILYTGDMTDTAIIDFAGKILMKQVEYGIQKRFSDSRLIKELSDEEVIKNGKNGTKFWLIAFYNSKDNTTRTDFKQMVQHAAEDLQDSVNIGAFDINKRSTPYTYEEMPTVVLFHGKKSDRYEVEYSGEFYGNKLVDFVLTRIKPPQVQELWTENILVEMCQLKKYCMLTFIPSVPKCNSKCKDKFKDVLTEVVDDYKTLSASWAMIRHGVMKTAEKLFDITDDAPFPIFVMVEVKTLKSEYLADKFEVGNIKSMISEILTGEGFTGRTVPIFDHLPSYKPWLRDEL